MKPEHHPRRAGADHQRRTHLLHATVAADVTINAYPNLTPRYFYLPEVYLHELGHTLGLHDLDLFLNRSVRSVMYRNPVQVAGMPTTTVLDYDIGYVQAVYCGHPEPVHRPG